MLEDFEKAATENQQEANEQVVLTLMNVEAFKEAYKELDEAQRFRLQTASSFFQKTSELVNAGTATYEKLILLDGATIALSITFLGSLSSRLAASKVFGKPHLWMVGVSWSLLIVSIYCCYRVILDRHSAMYRLLGNVSKLHTEYLYQRLGVLFSTFGQLVKGPVPVGEKKVDFSQITAMLCQALKKESESQVKKIDDFITEGKKDYKEGAFARIAVTSTVLAVVFLSLFTILSLRLLF